MKKKNGKLFILVAVILCVFLAPFFLNYFKKDVTQEIINLRAFAKLYGYVRYFHPSDEASHVDWDKFAYYGVGEVKDAKDIKELKTKLEELFLPIAPTMQLYFKNETPKPIKEFKDTKSLKLVTWQYFGIRTGEGSNMYQCNRINTQPYNYLSRILSGIDSLQGKEYRLTFFAKANLDTSNGCFGEVFICESDYSLNKMPENTPKVIINDTAWKKYVVRKKIENKSLKNVIIGAFLNGTGKLWIDNFSLQTFYKKKWVDIKIKNCGFETDTITGDVPGWFITGGGKMDCFNYGYKYSITSAEKYSEKKSLLIESIEDREPGSLFKRHANYGEVIKKEIAPGLFCQIPLALYADKKGTLGQIDKKAFTALQKKLSEINFPQKTVVDENLRLADVIVAWNILQHFYPYFDVVKIDWDRELTTTLKQAMFAVNQESFHIVLFKFIEKIKDGHAHVNGTGYGKSLKALPFLFDWVENKIIITNSSDARFKKGDILVSINGTSAEKILNDKMALVSGSPQWKRFSALYSLNCIDKDDAVVCVQRDNREIAFNVEANDHSLLMPKKYRKIEKLPGNIYYLNFDELTGQELDSSMCDITNSAGIVVDQRGYPNFSIIQLISHLIKTPVQIPQFFVPLIIYPDQENMAWDTSGRWKIDPEPPYIKSRVAFITNGSAISFAELILGIVEYYKFAAIIGEPSAGTDGNINSVDLPGGYTISFTGMKCLKNDGSQHHLIGILPSIPCSPTIKGIKEGRDEQLERAIQYINTGK